MSKLCVLCSKYARLDPITMYVRHVMACMYAALESYYIRTTKKKAAFRRVVKNKLTQLVDY